jgi:hypothetical protein
MGVENDDTMGKNEYSKEVQRRIMERIEMRYGTRRATIISIVSPLIVNGVAYLVFRRLWGTDTANQQILGFCIGTVSLEFVLLGILLFFWRFYDVPEEIYNEQRKTIDSRIPNQLNIFVGPSPMRGWKMLWKKRERDIRTVYLTVISKETKKIVEFHATRLELLQRTADMEPNLRGATFGPGVNNFRFQWENEDVFTSLIPGDKGELLIAELNLTDGYPVFGQPKSSPLDSDKPSIYEVYIQFRGKLEGETDFGYYNYRTEIYCHPENGILEFVEFVSNIPDELKSKVLFSNRNQEE